MKPRTVIVTLEVETDAPLDALKKHFLSDSAVKGEVFNWRSGDYCDLVVLQAQVNVVKPKKVPS